MENNKKPTCSLTGINQDQGTIILCANDIKLSDKAVFIALNTLIESDPIKYYGRVYLAALKAGQLALEKETE